MKKMLKVLETNKCLVCIKYKHTFDKTQNGGAYI